MPSTATTVIAPVLVKTVTAGTAVQFPSLSGEAAAQTVVIQALGTNKGNVVIGDKNVVAAPGIQATPTQRGIMLEKNNYIAIDIAGTGNLWLDSVESKDGVSLLVLA